MSKDKTILSNAIASSTEMLLLGVKHLGIYTLLNLNADDYGIVGGQKVLQSVKMQTRYLDVLIEAGFLKLLKKEGYIVYITDWVEHNSNRDVRYIKPSRYLPLLAEVLPNQEIVMPYATGLKKNGSPKYNKRSFKALEALEVIKNNKYWIDKSAELSRDIFISYENPREKMCQEKISQEKRREEFSSLDKEKESIFSSPGGGVVATASHSMAEADCSEEDLEELYRLERNKQIGAIAGRYAKNNPNSILAEKLTLLAKQTQEKGR